MGVHADSLVRVPPEAAGCDLREMVEADLDAVVAIESEWSPTPWSRATFRNELAIAFSRSTVVVAPASPGEVWGYLVRWFVAGDVRLLALAVRRDRRRRGLGRWMLDALLEEARKGNAACVTLEVAAENHAARALYASRGFCVVGRRGDYYGAGRDALLFDLRLGCCDVS